MKQIINPDANGDLCCGFESGENSYIVTGGVKAPRMTGMENLRLFLHNGSVDSLEQNVRFHSSPHQTVAEVMADLIGVTSDGFLSQLQGQRRGQSR